MTIGLNKEATTCSVGSKNSDASIVPSDQPRTVPHMWDLQSV
jgi:hypothetical protein